MKHVLCGLMALLCTFLFVSALGETAFEPFDAPLTNAAGLSPDAWYETPGRRALLTVLLSLDLAQSGDRPSPDLSCPSCVGLGAHTLTVAGTCERGALFVIYAPQAGQARLLIAPTDVSQDLADIVIERTLRDTCEAFEVNDPSALAQVVRDLEKAFSQEAD